MKKLVFAAVAAIALTASVSFVACNQPAACADSTCVDSVVDAADSVAVDTVAADSVE